MSDIKAAEPVAAQGAAPEASATNDAAIQPTPAVTEGPAEGAPAAAPTDEAANLASNKNTTEPKTGKTTEAGGRKEKSLMQKMMFWKKDKKAGTAAATS